MKRTSFVFATVLALTGSLALAPAQAKHRHHHKHHASMMKNTGSSGPAAEPGQTDKSRPGSKGVNDKPAH